MAFRDHFTGSSLDATRWTAITAGNGAVTVTDSYVQCDTSGATTDAAAFYYNTKIDKTVSQLWLFHSTVSAVNISKTMAIVQSATPPAVDSSANWDGNANLMRIRATVQTAVVTSVGLAYWPTGGGTRVEWETAGAAWSGTAKNALSIAADHYTCIGWENDATNARWRFLIWGPVTAGAGADKHGMVLLALTDWVLWSALGTTDSLYLLCGDPVNNAGQGVTRWELIELQDGTKQYALTNGQSAAGQYRIRANHGYADVDGGVSVWLPFDRATLAIDVGGGGTWDAVVVKDPYMIGPISGTYYCFYNGEQAAGEYQIGLATATDPEGTWTKDAANPIIATNGTTRDSVWFPGVVYDTGESDTNKRWKMWFTASPSTGTLPQTTWYTTSADAVTWATPAQCFSVPGAGNFQSNGHERPRPYFDGAQWVIFLGAKKDDATVSIRPTYGTATLAAPGTITLSNTVLLEVLDAGSQQDITADITNTRTIVVGSTASFAQDTRCVIDQDATSGDYTECIIRKVTDGTTMEAYEQMTGFTAAGAGHIRAVAGWGRLVPADVVRVGSEYWMYATVFNPMQDHASYSAGCENTGLLKSSSLTSGWAHYKQRPTTASRNNFGSLISNENITTAHAAVNASIPTGGGPRPLSRRRIPFLGKRKRFS